MRTFTMKNVFEVDLEFKVINVEGQKSFSREPFVFIPTDLARYTTVTNFWLRSGIAQSSRIQMPTLQKKKVYVPLADFNRKI